eukprot:gene2789-1774_t
MQHNTKNYTISSKLKTVKTLNQAASSLTKLKRITPQVQAQSKSHNIKPTLHHLNAQQHPYKSPTHKIINHNYKHSSHTQRPSTYLLPTSTQFRSTHIKTTKYARNKSRRLRSAHQPSTYQSINPNLTTTALNLHASQIRVTRTSQTKYNAKSLSTASVHNRSGTPTQQV